MKDFFKYLNLEGKAYFELIVRREDLKTKYNNESCSYWIRIRTQ